jgi:pyruvate-formate lyase-activating enzyme
MPAPPFAAGDDAAASAARGLCVRIVQLDGELPNLALMKLSAYHQERGDRIIFTRNARRAWVEPTYDRVYASTIFTRSRPLVDRLLADFPQAIVGGTGLYDDDRFQWKRTVEDVLGIPELTRHDYSIVPSTFTASVGMSMTGCRFACGFCRVPEKEGRARAKSDLERIWRGDPYPRHLHLMDNDFFGVPRATWEARVHEMIEGRYRISLSQGINVRAIDATIAKVVRSMPLYDHKHFKTRRVYTAWDNLEDEARFFRGIEHLGNAGVPLSSVLVYMLVGWDTTETFERIEERHNKLVRLGLMPFPMVFEQTPRVTRNGIPWLELKKFQRWAIRYAKFGIPWQDYRAGARPDAMKGQPRLFTWPSLRRVA